MSRITRIAAAVAARDAPPPVALGETAVGTVASRGPPGANIAGTRRAHRTELGSRQETNVFITINTNLKTRDHELAVAQLKAARAVTIQMFGTALLEESVDVDERLPLDIAGGRAGLLGPIRSEITAEYGARGSIHTHATIRITHQTRVFFNRLKMKAIFQERMNEISASYDGTEWMRRGPNIKVKLLANTDQEKRLREYLRKDLPDGEPDDEGPADVTF